MISLPILNFNGDSFSQEDKIFTIHNRAFRYGDGLFETIRMSKGKLLFWDYHLSRLKKGMEALRFSNVESFTDRLVESEIVSLAHKNKLYKDARIRLTIFRNDGGFYAPKLNSYSYLIELWNLEEEGYQWGKKGLLIDIYADARKNEDYLSAYKTLNALPYVLAGVHKNELRVDDCIILNHKNNMVETTTSNLFLVKNGMLFTPALNEGCINGVMRKIVIKLAKEMNIVVHEIELNPELLQVSDEIFLTNVINGIQWVVGYGEKRYYSRMAKLLYEKLKTITT